MIFLVAPFQKLQVLVLVGPPLHQFFIFEQFAGTHYTMGKFKFLDLVKPFQYALPEIEKPYMAHLSFDDRILYSIGISIFFLFSQLPIYGVKSTNLDPFSSLRYSLGSDKGLLDEFGLLPVLTAGFFWQILSGFRIINVNFGLRTDRTLFQLLQKLTAFFLGAFYPFVLVFVTDYYNPQAQFAGAINIAHASSADAVVVSGPSFGLKFLIWLQLFVYNVVTTYLVEILDKDYGFTSGAMFLIAVNSSVALINSMVDFATVLTSAGVEYRGVLVQLFFVLKDAFFGLFTFNLAGAFRGVVHLFARTTAPNLKQVLLAVVAGALMFYFQSMHQAVSIKPKQAKTVAQNFPVKLFYNGALPLIFAASVLYNVQFASYSLYKFATWLPVGRSLVAAIKAQFDDSAVVESLLSFLIGSYSNDPVCGKTRAIAGLALFFQAPLSLVNALYHPLKTIVYFAVQAGLVIAFSAKWAWISGGLGKEIADMLAKQNITILGRRDVNMAHHFNKLVANASAAGGLLLAAISVGLELLGAQGLAGGVVVGVLVTFTFLETFVQDFQQSGGSSMFYNGMFGQ